MSGLTANLIGNDLFQRFTADGTWKKPAGIKMVAIECVGSGGGGAFAGIGGVVGWHVDPVTLPPLPMGEGWGSTLPESEGGGRLR